MCAALTAMILSAYLVSSVTIYNVAVYVHLWTGVVVLLVSIMMIAINLAAYVGCYYQNRALLMMYAGVLITGMVMFSVVAIASFLYGSTLAFYRHGDQYTGLSDATADEPTARIVRQYDLGLGGGCIIGFVLAIIPLRLACTMVCRLGKVQEKKVTLTLALFYTHILLHTHHTTHTYTTHIIIHAILYIHIISPTLFFPHIRYIPAN